MVTGRIVIVGGGAIGSAIACFLLLEPSFRGSVTIVERDPSYAQASSARSASSIRQQFSTPVNIRIGLAGIDFLRRAGELLAVDGIQPEIGLTEPGYLFLATAAGAGTLRSNHSLQRREGADIDLLEPATLKQRFAWLNVDDLALGAHGVRGEGWFDGYSLLQAYRRKAIALGARYVHAQAVGFNRQPAKTPEALTAVKLADGSTIDGDWFVNAAGPWARTVAEWVGIELPVSARRRSVYVFETPATLPACPLLIDPSGVYFRPDGRGFICGVSPPPERDPENAPLDPEPMVFEEIIWPALAHRVPALESLRQTRSWAGYYEMNTFDANGIVGAHPAVRNLVFANGFSGHGIQQSPAVGRAVAEWLVHGDYRSLDLHALGFDRLLENKPLLERNVV